MITGKLSATNSATVIVAMFLIAYATHVSQKLGVIPDSIAQVVSAAWVVGCLFVVSQFARGSKADNLSRVSICLLLLIVATFVRHLLQGGSMLAVAGAELQRNPLALVISTAIDFSWYLLPILLVLMQANQMLTVERKMADEVANRTKELSEANVRLQREVCERMLLANERDQARLELEGSLSQSFESVSDDLQLRSERLVAINQVSNGIAHELNNTLTPVLNYVNLLRSQDNLNEQQVGWLDQLSAAANEAICVIRNLKLFGLDGSRDTIHSVSVASLVARATEDAKPVWKREANRIQVEADVDPALMVNGCPEQLVQVMTNLIVNATEAIGDREGEIKISAKSEFGVVKIAVTDTGRGMTHEEIKRCFDPFYSTKPNGAGLGMSVCHGIVQNHGGSFDISTDSGGTTVTFHLPTAIEEKDDNPTEHIAAEPLSGTNILLVEDNPSVRVSVADMLEATGAEVTAVENSELALDFLEFNECDIVLSDLGLPDMDGAELTQRIKSITDTPVILMSGWPRRRIMKYFEGKSKPHAILPKPTPVSNIIETIQGLKHNDDPQPTHS